MKPDIQTFADGVRITCLVLGQVFGNLSITLIVAEKHTVFVALLIVITCSIITVVPWKYLNGASTNYLNEVVVKVNKNGKVLL